MFEIKEPDEIDALIDAAHRFNLINGGSLAPQRRNAGVYVRPKLKIRGYLFFFLLGLLVASLTIFFLTY